MIKKLLFFQILLLVFSTQAPVFSEGVLYSAKIPSDIIGLSENYTGQLLLDYAIYDETGPEDWKSSGVSTVVNKGVFTVNLGDTSVKNMEPLKTELFGAGLKKILSCRYEGFEIIREEIRPVFISLLSKKAETIANTKEAGDSIEKALQASMSGKEFFEVSRLNVREGIYFDGHLMVTQDSNSTLNMLWLGARAGFDGPKGEEGPKGPRGARGAEGPEGPPGATSIVTVNKLINNVLIEEGSALRAKTSSGAQYKLLELDDDNNIQVGASTQVGNVVFQNVGKLGIGTNSPLAKVDVAGGAVKARGFYTQKAERTEPLQSGAVWARALTLGSTGAFLITVSAYGEDTCMTTYLVHFVDKEVGGVAKLLNSSGGADSELLLEKGKLSVRNAGKRKWSRAELTVTKIANMLRTHW
jgi:hypothetical protein